MCLQPHKLVVQVPPCLWRMDDLTHADRKPVCKFQAAFWAHSIYASQVNPETYWTAQTRKHVEMTILSVMSLAMLRLQRIKFHL